jgi:hypothetical protein
MPKRTKINSPLIILDPTKNKRYNIVSFGNVEYGDIFLMESNGSCEVEKANCHYSTDYYAYILEEIRLS